ncbi:MAG: FtsX-like permease family protein [Planctomycetes bacterium]|nr:FtsX-like permease family protein [Planctomycetota bacterium]
MARLLQTLRIGVFSLLLHKLRSGLAVLGILIGITAVIWLVALGEGVSYQAQQQIKDLGATNVIVRSVKPTEQGSSGGTSSFFLEYGILRDDFKRILSNVPGVEKAVPMREIRKEIRFQERSVESRVVGCTPDYFSQNRLTLDRGRFLTPLDGAPPTNVCVLAASTAQQLFPLTNPIGQTVKIENDFYVVVGRTAERDPTAAIGGSLDSQDFDFDAYIPIETLRARIGDTVFTSRSGSREGEVVQLSQVTVTIRSLDDVDQAADIIRTLMEKYHPRKDFGVVVPKELLRQAELLRMMFNLLLVLIAGISLVVGGIGIMNIMLATVTERTREIGVRRALGARKRDIVHQFLIEAVVLTGLGGSLGVGLGAACGPTVDLVRVSAERFFPAQMSALPQTIKELEPRIATWSILASLGIAVGVGVVFGLYPAYRAANMDPIEALRHE